MVDGGHGGARLVSSLRRVSLTFSRRAVPWPCAGGRSDTGTLPSFTETQNYPQDRETRRCALHPAHQHPTVSRPIHEDVPAELHAPAVLSRPGSCLRFTRSLTVGGAARGDAPVCEFGGLRLRFPSLSRGLGWGGQINKSGERG